MMQRNKLMTDWGHAEQVCVVVLAMRHARVGWGRSVAGACAITVSESMLLSSGGEDWVNVERRHGCWMSAVGVCWVSGGRGWGSSVDPSVFRMSGSPKC